MYFLLSSQIYFTIDFQRRIEEDYITINNGRTSMYDVKYYLYQPVSCFKTEY